MYLTEYAFGSVVVSVKVVLPRVDCLDGVNAAMSGFANLALYLDPVRLETGGKDARAQSVLKAFEL
ncbi:hypothetical protein [Salipiger thiooxidans]|uniref:hypothetical protein n=1 Tax=Salipiger thiooxidans TaxID=282683 RepID=UPI001CD6F8A4|nr:hypothetical protein [Salipiger thiooxidans]MCA0851003.1 hypothetical protein [Salipiger thiooxidans]